MKEIAFTGVTLGPIYGTMLLTSRPGGLWAASYLFSWIAERLISALLRDRIVLPEDFVSPVVLAAGSSILPENCKAVHAKGVGLFHDHIIFRGDHLRAVGTALDAVIEELSGYLPGMTEPEVHKAWLRSYLRIYAVSRNIPEDQNPILMMGDLLDTVELEPQYVEKQTLDPLLYLFENVTETGRNAGANEQLHNSFLVKDLDDWMLRKGTTIRDIPDIACPSGKPERKWQEYYAILKSDGDNIGKALQSITVMDNDLSALRAYSTACLSFCAEACQRIYDYGGMPIYAGGDDLLAIIPVAGSDGRSLFALVSELNLLFDRFFRSFVSSEGIKPTLSLGISVQFMKSPLFEALERAGVLLEEAKKQFEETETEKRKIKNTLCLNLQKHSGQNVKLVVRRLNDSQQLSLLDDLIKKLPTVDQKELELFLSGAGYQIERHEKMFQMAAPEWEMDAIGNLFDNLFDNAGQAAFRETYLKDLKKLFQTIRAENREELRRNHTELCVEQMKSVVRYLHFMQEKRGKKN